MLQVRRTPSPNKQAIKPVGEVDLQEQFLKELQNTNGLLSELVKNTGVIAGATSFVQKVAPWAIAAAGILFPQIQFLISKLPPLQ